MMSVVIYMYNQGLKFTFSLVFILSLDITFIFWKHVDVFKDPLMFSKSKITGEIHNISFKLKTYLLQPSCCFTFLRCSSTVLKTCRRRLINIYRQFLMKSLQMISGTGIKHLQIYSRKCKCCDKLSWMSRNAWGKIATTDVNRETLFYLGRTNIMNKILCYNYISRELKFSVFRARVNGRISTIAK
jgi:hypothetical protein